MLDELREEILEAIGDNITDIKTPYVIKCSVLLDSLNGKENDYSEFIHILEFKGIKYDYILSKDKKVNSIEAFINKETETYNAKVLDNCIYQMISLLCSARKMYQDTNNVLVSFEIDLENENGKTTMITDFTIPFRGQSGKQDFIFYKKRKPRKSVMYIA